MITGLLTRHAPCHVSLLLHHDADADLPRATQERLSEVVSMFLGQHVDKVTQTHCFQNLSVAPCLFFLVKDPHLA